MELKNCLVCCLILYLTLNVLNLKKIDLVDFPLQPFKVISLNLLKRSYVITLNCLISEADECVLQNRLFSHDPADTPDSPVYFCEITGVKKFFLTHVLQHRTSDNCLVQYFFDRDYFTKIHQTYFRSEAL